MFQSTHSRRVRPDQPIKAIIYSCFNPRTHEECDWYRHRPARRHDVSIHALTKSATCFNHAEGWRVLVSIHALTKSATSCSEPHSNSCPFQSTHSRRVRRELGIANQAFAVSIHALTKSATGIGLDQMQQELVSIHALTKSATLQYGVVSGKFSGFQSTHSRRVRPNQTIGGVKTFNVSIHALTKSATRILPETFQNAEVSIHALTKSATTGFDLHGCQITYRFNPRTHEECDSLRRFQLWTNMVSIHALTKSATHDVD